MKSLSLFALLAALVPSSSASVQTTALVSLSSTGVQGNEESWQESLSASGRFLAFYSDADNLAPGDFNDEGDVFVRDLQTGRTQVISVNPMGLTGNGESEWPSLSASGRYLAFFSEASDLVPDDTNGVADIFVRDLKTGVTTRVSVDSDGNEGLGDSGPFRGPTISADGRHVAYYSLAPNLVADDTNGTWDVFVHDRATRATARVSIDSNGRQSRTLLVPRSAPALSADGRFVAFESDAIDLVPDDTNNRPDIFVHDRQVGVTRRVSVSAAGAQAAQGAYQPSLSANGRFVAFSSFSPDLIPGDVNVRADIFVKDLSTGDVKLVSVGSLGQQADGANELPVLSADGRHVVFESRATNLVPGDTNDRADIYLRDLKDGTIVRISVGDQGQECTNSCYIPTMSADARTIAFWTAGANLVPRDLNGTLDIFLRRFDGVPTRRATTLR